MKNDRTLFLTVKAKGRLEAVDRFLDILEQLPNVELHGDYKRIRADDTKGVNYHTLVNVLIRDGRSPPSSLTITRLLPETNPHYGSR
ncbi:MAG: hypothetical protein ABSA50_11885 [Candidatus Bathyarchaeia archaeon]|jgi:hypothetical protein